MIQSIQKVIKIGSSGGVTIPAKEMKQQNIKYGDQVEVIVRPVQPAKAEDEKVLAAAKSILKEYKEAAEKHHLTLAEEFARREALAREVSPTFPLLACVCESNQQALQKTLKPAPQTASAPSFISRLFGLRTLPPMQPSSPKKAKSSCR